MKTEEAISYTNSILEKDRSILINPDKNDIDLICNAILNQLNSIFPNRTFNVKFESKNFMSTFKVKEVLTSLDFNGNKYTKEINLERYYMNSVINLFVSDKTKQYLLNKYKDHLEDYADNLQSLFDATNVYFKMNPPKEPFEIKRDKYNTIKFTCYKQSPSGLGKFLFFKTYTMKYNICTYADYRNIKKIIKEAQKKLS